MAVSSRIRTFEDFANVHAILLAAAGIPASLHERLFRKLSSETFDGGDFFSIEPCDGGRRRRLVLTAPSLAKDSDVFLVDHAWTFRLSEARKQLIEVPGLAERMAALMCVDVDLEADAVEGTESGDGGENGNEVKIREILEREMENVRVRGGEGAAWLEFEELGIDDDMLCSLDLSSKFPNLVALNLWGNKLQNAERIFQEISKCRRLKALWLNENPVLLNFADDIGHAISDHNPVLEIFDSKFTRNYGHWALGFCGGIFSMDNPVCFPYATNVLESITALDLSNRCIHKLHEAFSPVSMPHLSQLNLRGNAFEQNSAEDLLKILGGFFDMQVLEVDIPGPLGNSAIRILESLPQISLLNGVSTANILESGKHIVDSMLLPRLPEWKPTEPLADQVIGAMWLYLMTYRLADQEKIDETSVWYVMDELGSALRHSDEANFQVAPFLFMPEGKLSSAVSYTVLWPIQDVQNRGECTRDFLFGIREDKQRSARLTAWFHTPQNYFIQEFKNYCQLLQPKGSNPSNIGSFVTRSILPADGRPLLLYTDIPYVEEFLKRPEFVFTTDPKNADIVWTSFQVDDEVKNALGLTDRQYINQFPFEACLVMKHHLAETIHKAQGSPDWLQPTYNLESQLSQLIGDYCVRRRDGRDNLWILKPWNMARTLDTTVTGDISAIIRIMETGPKICQKYIERPALFRGKKFDLRYIVLVRSMNPVEIFLSDVFWVRLANNPYSLDKSSLFEYETHFTVMNIDAFSLSCTMGSHQDIRENYIGRLNHMNTPEFVREFEAEHQVKWLDIHQRIRNIIRSVFDSAAVAHPEMHDSFSRAMYGVDVMLDSSFMPKVLEVTYCPDCTRACKYDTEAVVGNEGIIKAQDFFNNVFGCLFLDESTNVSPL